MRQLMLAKIEELRPFVASLFEDPITVPENITNPRTTRKYIARKEKKNDGKLPLDLTMLSDEELLKAYDRVLLKWFKGS